MPLRKFKYRKKSLEWHTINIKRSWSCWGTVEGTFRSDEIEALQSSLFIERENVAAELQLKQAQELEAARRKIFLDQDSQFKAIDRLREKQREEHFSVENKMEQAELEDVIGSRFYFKE